MFNKICFRGRQNRSGDTEVGKTGISTNQVL